MIRIIGSDGDFIQVVGVAPVAGIPPGVPDTSRPGSRDRVTDSAQVVAVPLASGRARLALRRNPWLSEPLLRVAADYSVSVPPPGGDERDALWPRRRGKGDRRRRRTALPSDRIWVT